MSYQVHTLTDLKTRLSEKVDDSPFWTATELTNAINQSLQLWNVFTGQWRTRIVIPTVANQVWYSITSSLTFAAKFQFGSYPVDYSSLTDLDSFIPKWEGQTTASGGVVPTRPKLWAPAGLTLFAIYPADAVGGNQLAVDGIANTPKLVNDADFLDLGEEELNILLGEALHNITFKEGSERFDSVKDLHKQFIKAAISKNQILKASSYFRKFELQDTNRLQVPMTLKRKQQPGQQQDQSAGDSNAY
jgi:hypothetical protein